MLELARADLTGDYQPMERAFVAELVRRLEALDKEIRAADPRRFAGCPCLVNADLIVAATTTLRKLASLDENTRTTTALDDLLNAINSEGPRRSKAMLEVHRAYAAITPRSMDPEREISLEEWADQATKLVDAVDAFVSNGSDVWFVENLKRLYVTLDQWLATYQAAAEWVEECERRKDHSKCTWCDHVTTTGSDEMRRHNLSCEKSPVVQVLKRLQEDVMRFALDSHAPGGARMLPPAIAASLGTIVEESRGFGMFPQLTEGAELHVVKEPGLVVQRADGSVEVERDWRKLGPHGLATAALPDHAEIYLNGRKRKVQRGSYSYNDLARLASVDPERVPTISWTRRNPLGRIGGELAPGEQIDLIGDEVVNVQVTGNT